MITLQKRLETLLEVFDVWLSDESEYLKRAVSRSVEEGYFSLSDIQYALKGLEATLNRSELEHWIAAGSMSEGKELTDRNVLCLHAGNLPLVGFQDALAVLLSGARYVGKISRKDPYLLPTFLNAVKKTELWDSMDVQWTHRLDDFEDMQSDAILFAGSEESVPGVKNAIERYNLQKPDTRFLIRTAHSSMAYFDRQDPEQVRNLVEGILRYGGKGCRSVAVVVSPFSLNEVKDKLIDSIESFWQDNPQHADPQPKLKRRFAYKEALGRSQIWLEDFLVQEGGLELDQDFICYWVEGNEETAAELAGQFGDRLQNIYITDPEIDIPGWEETTAFLADAQNPPVYWKPDGVDTLHWLVGE